MSPTTIAQSKPTPVISRTDLPSELSHTGLPEDPKLRFYILTYRYGYHSHLTKVFTYDGPLKEAIQRAREHCVRMQYIFIWCRPFVVDLDLQEKAKRDDPYYSENIVK